MTATVATDQTKVLRFHVERWDTTVGKGVPSAAQLAAEDAEWDAVFEAKADVLDRMIAETNALIAAGHTRPLRRRDL